MNSRQHNALAVTAIIIGIIALTAMVVMIVRMGNGSAVEAEPQSYSFRSTFVEGCIEGGASRSQCECMHDGLLVDGAATVTDMERMVTGDFTDEEFDVIVGCAY